MQGLQYNHFALEPGFDLGREDSGAFRNALSVHPVSKPDQMYRLHKHFTEIELQRTYEEIEKLQVR